MRHPIATPASRALSLAILFLSAAAPQWAGAEETACGPTTPAEEQVIQLQQENALLSLKLKEIQARTISADSLRRKKAQRLKEIAADVKVQRLNTTEFEGFVRWMSTNLAGYSRYIQAGSHAAVLARFLPIPYAGQASVFTKFVSQFTLALNAASVSVNTYFASSQKFVAMAEALDPSAPSGEKSIAEAAQFADRQLLKDMQDAQARLSTVSDLSSGALSFLETLNHYCSSSDEYMNKLKGLVKKDVDPKEKSFLTENIGALKTQADRFNARLRSFELLAAKETTAIKGLAVYDELAAELAAPQ